MVLPREGWTHLQKLTIKKSSPTPSPDMPKGQSGPGIPFSDKLAVKATQANRVNQMQKCGRLEDRGHPCLCWLFDYLFYMGFYSLFKRDIKATKQSFVVQIKADWAQSLKLFLFWKESILKLKKKSPTQLLIELSSQSCDQTNFSNSHILLLS